MENSNKRSSTFKIFSRFSSFENFVMPPVIGAEQTLKLLILILSGLSFCKRLFQVFPIRFQLIPINFRWNSSESAPIPIWIPCDSGLGGEFTTKLKPLNLILMILKLWKGVSQVFSFGYQLMSNDSRWFWQQIHPNSHPIPHESAFWKWTFKLLILIFGGWKF